MAMSAKDFYDLVVKHECDDHLKYPLSLRHAMSAAIALHHLADYRALEAYTGADNRKEMGEAVETVRDALVAQCSHLAIIGDIADAFETFASNDSQSWPAPGPGHIAAASFEGNF
jgi:hypothetical protein